MNISEHQAWLTDFYKERDWYKLSPFIRLNFVTEEVGEVSQAIRDMEIGRDHPGEAKHTLEYCQNHLHEELGDALDQVLILASKYDIDAQDLLDASERKLKKRFNL